MLKVYLVDTENLCQVGFFFFCKSFLCSVRL